jgi:NNP family nitrate/nitrite transporter-like MFS transporter
LDALVARGNTPHVAWRVAFVVVPFITIMAVALLILFIAPDTPTGAWKDRHLNQPQATGAEITAATGQVVDVAAYGMESGNHTISSGNDSAELEKGDDLPKIAKVPESGESYDIADVQFAEATVVKHPSPLDVVKVMWSLSTIMQCACYFCTFGGELAINSSLSSFYIASSGKPAWSQTTAGNWAAMYGLLNVVTRPLGGYIGDCLYPVLGVEGKKFWMIFCKTHALRFLTIVQAQLLKV